jgi:RNA polymerase sigma factor (sigma-70 family)
VEPESIDARLRERLVAGDDDALAEVYDRWAALVHTVAARVTGDRAAAEDVTQEVFVQLWQRPERFDPARGTMRTWLCLLSRRRALDWVRRRSHEHRRATLEPPALDQPGVDEAVTWLAEAKAVREAVAALPEPHRVAVRLAYYQGRTYRQVAQDLDIPEGTAKSRLRVALASLADRLTAEGIIER